MREGTFGVGWISIRPNHGGALRAALLRRGGAGAGRALSQRVGGRVGEAAELRLGEQGHDGPAGHELAGDRGLPGGGGESSSLINADRWQKIRQQ